MPSNDLVTALRVVRSKIATEYPRNRPQGRNLSYGEGHWAGYHSALHDVLKLMDEQIAEAEASR